MARLNAQNTEDKPKEPKSKVYGSPTKTIPEWMFLEKLENGELKPGDVVYSHTTSCGNSKGKLTIQENGKWTEEKIDDSPDESKSKVHGSPTKTIPEGEFLGMIERGELKPGDVVYYDQTYFGNNIKCKFTMQENGEGTEEIVKDQPKESNPKVYGSPTKTISEGEFSEMLKKGLFEPGDTVYVHQTSLGNSKGKLTIQENGKWTDETI